MPINMEEEVGSNMESTAISALRLFAWLDLIGGIVFSIIIWAQYSTSKVDGGIFSAQETITNPVAIGIGIAVLLQGVFIWALFLVIASIAQNLISIRENTEQKVAVK